MNIPTHIENAADASIVLGMLKRGDRQNDIAAWFGLNGARICELNKMSTPHARKFKDVRPAPAHALPPPGPYSYFTPRPDASPDERLQQALGALDLKFSQALAELREELRTTAHERRQTNEMVARLERTLIEFGRKITLVEQPKTPRINRNRPLET